jgi:hypothetical protein
MRLARSVGSRMSKTVQTADVPSRMDEYPIHRARFVRGRSFHRIKRPATWYDLMEAACGKTGYLCTGSPMRPPGHCTGCYPDLAAAA